MNKNTLLFLTLAMLAAAFLQGCAPVSQPPQSGPLPTLAPPRPLDFSMPPDDEAGQPQDAEEEPPLVLDGIPDPNDPVLPENMSYEKDFDGFAKANPEVIGWIDVPNTRIHYPIALHRDNKYYLSRNYEGKRSKSGAVFMDCRNSQPAQQRNIIIYGHNMRNGTMFHDLSQYGSKEFFEQNRTLTLYINGQKSQWEVFSAFVATSDFYPIMTEFASDKEFESTMGVVKAKSKYNANIKITRDDSVLTLLTCSYEYDNSRFVVAARRVKA